MSVWGRAAGLVLGLGLGCAGDGIFVCSEHGDCNGGADGGTCQPSGYCSFPDDRCSSGERYGDHAGGGLAGHCVPASSGETGATDDGSDAASETSTSTSTTGSSTTDATTGSASTTVGVDDTGATTTGGGLPPGSSCSDDSECEGYCYEIGVLGGTCGECSAHEHCDMGGCNAPKPLGRPPVGSVCGTGKLGDGCADDADCDALVCANVVEIPGVITLDTCGECSSTDAGGCGAGQMCNPDIDVLSFEGFYACVQTGSVQLGETCDPAGGDAACASGICAQASVMGLFELGICSQCEADAECPEGQTCTPASVDLRVGTTPGQCG